METRYHNPILNVSDIPEAVGDRYYGQDLIRDFWNQREYSGQISQDLLNTTSSIIISGLTVSQGAGHTLSWTAGRVKMMFEVETPTDWTALPPTVTAHDIPIIIDIALATDQAIASADTGGVNVNYAKFSYNQSSTSTRQRAVAAGTYDSEIEPTYTFTCNTTPPTAYEVAFATFTSDGATLTFTNDEPRWNKVKAVTGTYTVKLYDKYISGSGTFAITMPTAASAKGLTFYLENIGTGILTLTPDGAETFEGLATIALNLNQSKIILYSNGTTYRILNKLNKTYSVITDYTAATTDFIETVLIPHSVTTGLFTGTLTAINTQTNREIRVQNNGDGLTKVVGNIKYKGNVLTQFYLYLDGDYVDLKSDGTYLNVEHCYSHIESGWYNRSDWANVHIGFSNFVYDNGSGTSTKSASWAGQKFTEATSNNTGIILADSSTGVTGTFTVYSVTGTGIFTDGRVITAGNGETIDVNEGTTNKDDDNNITHNMACILNAKVINWINSTASYTSAYRFEDQQNHDGAGNQLGIQIINIDTNNIQQQTGAQGIRTIQDNGGGFNLDNEDWYLNIVTEISA